jgi:hypothetical protein
MPKISQLESATDLTVNDLVPIVDIEDKDMSQSGTNKKITAGLLASKLLSILASEDVPSSGTFVLGAINGEIQWIGTESC